MRLLSDDIEIPTVNLPDPMPGAGVDENAEAIHAALFEFGGVFLTADDWGNVLLWTPRYEIGKPTPAQRGLAAMFRKIRPGDVTDLDLFLVGGAMPTTILAINNPCDN
jgi:hypothetical protein